VSVELTNADTGIVEQQVTSETGEFFFNFVPGGSYNLVVTLAGSKTQAVNGIRLGAAQDVRRRFSLEVGAM